MHAELPRHAWACVLLASVVLTTGCAALATGPGHDSALAYLSRPSPTLALSNTPGGEPGHAAEVSTAVETSGASRLRHRREPKREQGSTVALPVPAGATEETPATHGRVPPGWPHLESSRDVLAPFLECASPSELVALQRTVDMHRLVESLGDWEAVLLGALGPVSEDAAEALTRKRASFLVTATERYGIARVEVFALFILHTAFDDDLRDLLRQLARDKQLEETLGRMGTVRAQLAQRGMTLSAYPDRDERAGDVLRGLGRAGRDALSSTAVSDGARYADFTAKRGQLPPPYQEALDEVEQALMARHFSPGSVALGSFDHLTFGVPLGFYHLVVGTGQGAYSLSQGQYEQATRELAPAGLLVALYAGGKGARQLSEAGSPGAGVRRLQGRALSLKGLETVVDRLSERLGAGAISEVARYIQASREAGLLVAEWGEAGAAALHEARGNVPKAQAHLAEAKSQRAAAGGARGGGVTSGVLEAGPPREVLRAKLLQAELEATGARLPRDVESLRRHAPSLDAPPPGVPEGAVLWREYVTYRERRLSEIIEHKAVEGPLKWEGYQEMRGMFARGLDFERTMVSRLLEDAALPRARRQWLGDFEAPRIETHVGVAKADLRYVDVLVIEGRPPAGHPPRVETFSFKSRNLGSLGEEGLRRQMRADAGDALRYYGEMVRIRRPGLEMEVRVQRVRLIYEGGDFVPLHRDVLKRAVEVAEERVKGVEVLVQ